MWIVTLNTYENKQYLNDAKTIWGTEEPSTHIQVFLRNHPIPISSYHLHTKVPDKLVSVPYLRENTISVWKTLLSLNLPEVEIIRLLRDL